MRVRSLCTAGCLQEHSRGSSPSWRDDLHTASIDYCSRILLRVLILKRYVFATDVLVFAHRHGGACIYKCWCGESASDAATFWKNSFCQIIPAVRTYMPAAFKIVHLLSWPLQLWRLRC
jgi:hypothetical protein